MFGLLFSSLRFCCHYTRAKSQVQKNSMFYPKSNTRQSHHITYNMLIIYTLQNKLFDRKTSVCNVNNDAFLQKSLCKDMTLDFYSQTFCKINILKHT
jgi:hypothetical protein